MIASRLLDKLLRRKPKHEKHPRMGAAAERLAELRGDKVTAMPPDPNANSMENINDAVRDYGLSRFSGETDAIAKGSGSYRSSRRRRRRS